MPGSRKAILSSPQALERFIRKATAAADMETLIKLLDHHREWADIGRQLVRDLPESPKGSDAFRRACRRAGTTPGRFKQRLQTAATSLSLLAKTPPRNHYEQLAVAHDANAEAIRRAFRRQAQILHPDHNPDRRGESQAFIDLTQAYQTLIDPQRRRHYDNQLARSTDGYGPEAPEVPLSPPVRRFRFPVGLSVLLLLLVSVAFALDFIHRQGGLPSTPVFSKPSPRHAPVLKAAGFNPEPVSATPSVDDTVPDLSASAPADRPPERRENRAGISQRPRRRLSEIEPAVVPPPMVTTVAHSPGMHRETAAAPPPIPARGVDGAALAAAAAPMPADDPRPRLNAFLSRYCRAYESRDLRQLSALFHAEAEENGQPLARILPLYRSNLKRMDTLAYRIELDRYQAQQAPGIFLISGRFFARAQVVNQGIRESHGTIDMTLVAHGDSFLVRRLDYALTP